MSDDKPILVEKDKTHLAVATNMAKDLLSFVIKNKKEIIKEAADKAMVDLSNGMSLKDVRQKMATNRFLPKKVKGSNTDPE